MQEGPPQEINPLLCSASPADQPSPIWSLVEMQTAVRQQSFFDPLFLRLKTQGSPRGPLPLHIQGNGLMTAFARFALFAFLSRNF